MSLGRSWFGVPSQRPAIEARYLSRVTVPSAPNRRQSHPVALLALATALSVRWSGLWRRDMTSPTLCDWALPPDRPPR
jgi:hypothetical protein